MAWFKPDLELCTKECESNLDCSFILHHNGSYCVHYKGKFEHRALNSSIPANEVNLRAPLFENHFIRNIR